MVGGKLMKRFDIKFNLIFVITAILLIGGCSIEQKDNWHLIYSGILEDVEFSETPPTFTMGARNFATVKFQDGTTFRLRDYHSQSVFKIGHILYMYQNIQYRNGYGIYSTDKKRGE